MIKRLAIFLFAITLSSFLLIETANGQNIPNPNDQCKLLYGQDALFCQSSLSTICTALTCRINPNDTACVTASYAALNGTTCGLGRICSSGSCVAGQSTLPIDCLLGDGLLINQTQISDPLPLNQMTCSSFMSYLLANNKSPFVYCSNSTFRSLCCDTCKLYDKFPCRDLSPTECYNLSANCTNNSTLINNLPISIVCPFTCNCCPTKTLTCRNCLCQNGGNCTDVASTDNLLIGFYCTCPPGYYGRFCELKNPCSPNPCLNGGTCSRSGILNFVCQCRPAYTGPLCNATASGSTSLSDPCFPNPCANRGICNRNGTSYYCTCNVPYTGLLCATVYNPCQSASPCMNGGACIPNTISYPYYSCNCPYGVVGNNCQTTLATVTTTTTTPYNPCLPNPCNNNGICNPNGFYYTCQCPNNCYGLNCQYMFSNSFGNPCMSNPCLNGATCQPFANNTFSCLCNNLYSGTLCDRFKVGPSPCADKDVQFCYWIKARGYCGTIYNSYCPASCNACS